MTITDVHLRLLLSPKSKAIAAFALMILLSIGAFSFRSTQREEEDRGWVTHTRLVLESLEEILTDITQAESGQRGYLLTGDENYLKPFGEGVKKVQQEAKRFRELTSDNPRQQEAAGHLERLISERLAGLMERIEIRRQSGLVAASRAVATGNNGEELMNEIRDQISEMRQTEATLLSRRLEKAAASSDRMKAVVVFGNAVAISILLLAGSVIHQETMRRNLAEEDLKHSNERLERRTVELAETNNELESFSYSVAHDLRAPLRQVAGYSGLLSLDHGTELDDEARRLLHKIDEGARKMGQLVDDLLRLSKIGRQELSVEETPLDSLLRQVVAELEPEYSGRGVEWRIANLFSTECDPGLMKQVFTNLLSNAVKYTRKRECAVIEVGQMRQNNERVIFVRDNGAGFEMQYAGKLFGVFQRLHKAREFEGTGVGLAIVQRIIRKHGGRIWAEAELDQGATFFFTLGKPGSNINKKPEPATSNGVINVA